VETLFFFTFSSNLAVPPHMGERDLLFYLCLVPNAICFQLFKFSGKSGGAFTFPSNFPDLPHMNERFPLFDFVISFSRDVFQSNWQYGKITIMLYKTEDILCLNII